MVKVRFSERIETVETYDAGDYDRTSVPITELNETEFNEMECYRLEMKKQTIEEYQKRWRNRNSSSSIETNSSNSSESENISPILKSCLINRNSNNTKKLFTSTIPTTVPFSLPSSLEEESSLFREGQAQPNIIVLNTPHSSDYNSDEFHPSKNNVELSSSVESTNGDKLQLFNEPEHDESEVKEVMSFENQQKIPIISPVSFNGNDSPSSDNDADIEESEDDNNSFIRVVEDSFETKSNKDDDDYSDYIKDMSFTEGENSIALSHNVLSEDIPTTSFHSSNHRLFTDSLFNSSPILSEAVLETKEMKSSQIKNEIKSNDEVKERNKESLQESLVEEPEDISEEKQQNEEEEEEDVVDSHPLSDTYVNYGGTQHINIKPRRQNVYDDYTGVSSCPFKKPISFLDDLPETFNTPLSSSLPSTKSESSNRNSSTNFFGSPFSPTLKSPYINTSSSYTSRLNRLSNSSNYSNGSNSTNDGSYLVSKRNYLSISGNRDSKSKSYSSSSQHRLSHYTTSKWEGLGSRNNNKTNSNTSSNNMSNKYYPRPATKLASNSPFSSSWIYDASF